jgi:hypothetical protein
MMERCDKIAGRIMVLHGVARNDFLVCVYNLLLMVSGEYRLADVN